MAIEAAQQNVVVSDETPSVSVEADSNANSMVIKGKDLDALSDDPDELENQLQALAGPAAVEYTFNTISCRQFLWRRQQQREPVVDGKAEQDDACGMKWR